MSVQYLLLKTNKSQGWNDVPGIATSAEVPGGLPPVHNRKDVGQLWDLASAVLYKSTVACCMKLAEQTHGVFTPVLLASFETNLSSFPPLVRIFWAGVNTAIALGCRPNNRTETQLKRWSRSASKQTMVRLNGWTNEWMTLSTRVVLFTVSVSLAKRAAWKWTAPNKISIEFGLDQSKWTSGLSWCEYTLGVSD